jgi:predicted DNA-binding transcriptional regulator AlpA
LNYLKKHGFAPLFEVIETHDNSFDAFEREWELIQKFCKEYPLLQDTENRHPGERKSFPARLFVEERRGMQQYFTLKEVMAEYNVSRSAIYRQMKEKGIDPYKIGPRSIRLTKPQIKELFNTQNA